MRTIRRLFSSAILLAGLANCTFLTANDPADNISSVSTSLRSSGLPAEDGKESSSLIALAYYTGDRASYDSFAMFSDHIHYLAVDVFGVQMDGSISGADDLDVVSLAHSRAVQVFACVSNYNNDAAVEDFDPALAQAAILTHRSRVIENMVALAEQGGFDGVNVDFEGLAYSSDIDDDRAAFTAFIRELAQALHARGLQLIVSVPAATSSSPENTWAYPFDLAALGQAADLIQLMTYDQHGSWSAPGAVAGVDWVGESLRYALSQVAADKLLIGLPAYGYDWDLSASNVAEGSFAAADISWNEVPALLDKPYVQQGWDETSFSPFLTYTENGHTHEVWYENADSIRRKMEWMKEYDLAGFSVWALGKEDANFWKATE
ncbi:MAG: hypothetical protein GYA52_13325 [Chloroflexi bacterium]|nr:hypothetical protein [Chloroflexota bacterium]